MQGLGDHKTEKISKPSNLNWYLHGSIEMSSNFWLNMN